MRYFGSKAKLVDFILDNIKQLDVERVFDAFAGTCATARAFKKHGYLVETNDVMDFSYVLSMAYVENNESPKFDALGLNYDEVLKFLNNSKNYGFIYKNYTPVGGRMFYTEENGQIIDGARIQIENWKRDGKLKKYEYYVLLASLLESSSAYANTTGVFCAYLKSWTPRSTAPLELKPVDFIENTGNHKAHCYDFMSILNSLETDLLYLDPPYNHRQYGSNYHLLNTIALYDEPEIRGIAGLRTYQETKSSFCNAKSALRDLEKIIKTVDAKYVVMSYSNEGIMKQKDIFKLFKSVGKTELIKTQHKKYKSRDNNNLKEVTEHLYILEK